MSDISSHFPFLCRAWKSLIQEFEARPFDMKNYWTVGLDIS